VLHPSTFIFIKALTQPGRSILLTYNKKGVSPTLTWVFFDLTRWYYFWPEGRKVKKNYDFQDPQSGLRSPKVEGEGRLSKHPRVSGCSVWDVVKQKSAFQDTWFSNNQWFCLKITYWVIFSFTLNFVKKLYLIVWDALQLIWSNFIELCSI